MNGAMIKVLLFLATMLVSFSCGVNTPIPESLLNVKSVVERLDSAVTVMYGWEPRDSTYNRSVDTLVAGIMNQYNEDKPDYSPVGPSTPAVTQGAYNQARKLGQSLSVLSIPIIMRRRWMTISLTLRVEKGKMPVISWSF